jgi:serine/threonine-protein kinase
VLAPIGVGGMGEVFRARDTKLQRDVALKVLPMSVASDPDRLARFRREAQVLASLSHPNIASIFGLEESNGVQALVLELVEGPTLGDRIEAGALPIGDALAIAKQIAEAIEVAHEQGIVHRDLKPNNVKLGRDGIVKVLDFGLAKAREVASSAVARGAPTVAAAHTELGMVLGTVGYMSPEQACGERVDKRADIWAFGCVLYELLTGSQAFRTNADAVVTAHEPRWEALPTDLAPSIRRLLMRCLERDPKRRLRDIGEARIAIEDVMNGADTHAIRAASRWASSRALAVVGAAMMSSALAAGMLVWFVPRTPAEPVTRLALVPPPDAPLTDRHIAVSPDGRQLVYVSGSSLAVRSFDEVTPRRIPNMGSPGYPFVSPDGRWIGFFDGLNALKKVPITGGPAVVLTGIGGAAGRGASWGSDGYIVYATDDPATGLWRVHEDGGTPELLTRREQGDHTWPHVLPGARAVIFSDYSYPGEDVTLSVLDLTSRMHKPLVPGSHAQYSATGHLVYGASGSLRVIGFDAARLETRGIAMPVIEELSISRDSPAGVSLASNGTLTYVAGTSGGIADASRQLVWVDRDGNEEPVGAPPDAYVIARLSPDGTRIALDQRSRAGDGLTIWDIARKTRSRFSFGVDAYPVWAPDGSRLVFTSFDASTGVGNLVWQAADGSAIRERLPETSHSRYATSFSSDGRHVFFREETPDNGLDIGMLTIETEVRSDILISTPASELNPEISPDGRWLAYESNVSGTPEVYVRPFPDVESGLWQISEGGGTQPAWAKDGSELFYRATTGALVAASIESAPSFVAGAARQVVAGDYYGSGPYRTYDVAADGERFLMTTAGAAASGSLGPYVVVVQTWFAELERLGLAP